MIENLFLRLLKNIDKMWFANHLDKRIGLEIIQVLQ